MNIDKKTCINIGIVAFLLYLAIHYWDEIGRASCRERV